MQPRVRPDAAEATSETRRASMRRGLTTYLRLSHGRLEAGPGGGPASCCLEISPVVGRTRQLAAHNMRRREPAAWAAETDGKRNFQGGRRAALCLRTKAGSSAASVVAEARPTLLAGGACRQHLGDHTASDLPRRSTTMLFLRPRRGRLAQLLVRRLRARVRVAPDPSLPRTRTRLGPARRCGEGVDAQRAE
jgi:hypothetical protein